MFPDIEGLSGKSHVLSLSVLFLDTGVFLGRHRVSLSPGSVPVWGRTGFKAESGPGDSSLLSHHGLDRTAFTEPISAGQTLTLIQPFQNVLEAV